MSYKIIANSFLSKYNVKCKLNQVGPIALLQRHGHTLRGKPPGIARSIQQRLQDESVADAEVDARVNIGFPQLMQPRSEILKSRLSHLKTQKLNKLQETTHSSKFVLNLERAEEIYRKTTGPFKLRAIADHYGIFRDLFDSAFFVPRVPLNIKYNIDKHTNCTVHYGNIIKPSEAKEKPTVIFQGSTDPITGKHQNNNFWTLIATNPDTHTSVNNSETVHWMIVNIPNSDIDSGEVLVNYMPPFPPHGIGYQRFVFVLYKQKAKLDLSSYKLATSDHNNLEKRTFSTYNFYKEQQDNITPAGLAFYQTHWDETITNFYHNVLQMKEPIYAYDFPKAYLADQKFFPLKQPFNLYMDKHRDQKEVNKEYLERKLKKTHPFDGPEPPLRFPNAHPLTNIPSWLKTEIRKSRLGTGRVQNY